MKRLFSFIIIIVSCFKLVSGQEMDPVFTGTYSGTLTQTGRNSVTLGPDYTYNPSGGELTVEIQNPIVTGSVAYSSTPVDPETRTLNTSYLVGATKGSFYVNPIGGASYEIPLELLPGVNGISPSLSLTYSSNNGPGKAGYGWQIGGLSVLSRGPQTYYHDGAARGVELDLNDRFYLDGQRLVNTTSYSYGDANAQYRTDNDIFTRVTPQSVDANGPAWLKAETKSGLIYEYGNNSGAKQKISGYSQVVKWYVSSIKDLFNNQINFAYIQDNNSIYPAEITYGPNTITLNYKERSDKTTSYLKGVKIQQNLILDKITVKYNSYTVKTYELKYTYQGSSYNSYSNLNEIIEYGIGSSRFNSTAITYQIPANVSFTASSAINHAYIRYTSKMLSGDFNGDGKSDIVCLPTDGMKVYFSDGNDYFTTYLSESTNLVNVNDIRILDINSDGKDDILFEQIISGTYYFKYMLYDGTPFADPVTIISQTTAPGQTGLSGKMGRLALQEDDNEHNIPGRNSILMSDYNGDGVNDVFLNDPSGNWSIRSFANSSGVMTTVLNTLASGQIATLNSQVFSGDFDGDGKTDIWSFENTLMRIYSFSGSSLTQVYTSNALSKKHYFTLGDFNSDGKVDIFLYGDFINDIETDYLLWQIYSSTGSGFETNSFWQKKSNLKDDYVRSGDFNGDGASDIMVTKKEISWSGSYFYISMNKGTDFYSHSFSYTSSTNKLNLADFNGDGKIEYVVTINGQTNYLINRYTGNTNTLAEKIGNGLGALIKPSYTKLSQASTSFYQRGTGAAFPLADFQGPWIVVSSVLSDNGKGSMNTQNYYYEGAKIHLQGKGFLSYMKMRITDVALAIDNENMVTGYDPIYYYPLITRTLSKRAGTNDTITVVKNTMDRVVRDAQKKWIFPYIRVSKQSDKLMGDNSIIVSSVYDNYGNPTSIIKSYSNGPTETTTNTFNNTDSPSQWLVGRATGTSIQYTGGGNTITRSATRVFSTSSNNLTSETWHSGTSQQIEKSFIYNTTGTISSETATANSVSRTTIYTYKADNIRINTITDPLSHVTTSNYDNYGRLNTRSDYLNNTVTYQYDDMGREIVVTSTFGDQTTTTFAWETPTSVPKPARYSILKTGNEGSQAKSWFDKLGREIRSDVKGFNGTWIYTSKRFNLKGQIDSTSNSYYSNGTPLWDKHSYDYYGRITSIERASGQNSYWTYNNNVVDETSNHSVSKTYSSDGSISSADDDGGTMYYTYFPDGKIKSITAPGNIITQMQYDIAGNQTQLNDKSAGIINYTYNGFGELLTQQNARIQTTTITYNTNATISTKVTPEGTTTYTYNSNKQLTGISSPGGVSRTYGYDTKGRVSSVTETIPGSSSFVTSYSYDSYGRLSTITHPSGIVETRNYNSNGYLSSVSAGGSTRWTTSAMNALQQVTSGQYGSNLSVTFGYNSYGYPTSTVSGTIQNYSYNFNSATGNLNWRQNNKYTGLKEDFYYDGLDRLDYIMKGTTTTLDMAYHWDKGGIFTKSDVGSFLYNNTTKPYALSEISPTSMIIPNSVDSLTYTSFESVKTIQEDPYSATFVYNAGNGRAKMEVKQNTTTILTRWYPSGSYIKETASGTTKEYTFIGGDPYTAPVVGITQSGTTTYYYLLRDHLGSITHVVDASSGTLSYQYSYDAWGRMRTYSGWVNYDPGSEPALFIAGRGFTGHEHLPWFNLINMNGRMYDPLAGQFLSPDKNIQDPYNSQNLNRYSYCVNNPLKYSDPTGFNVSVTVQYVHDIVYGPQSHVDQMLKELFGAMYEDVFHGGFDYAFLISGFGGNRGGGGNINGKTQDNKNGYSGDPIYDKAVLGGGPNSKFSSLDLAAMDFGIRYNDNSISRGLEFGTVFYSGKRKGVSYYSYNIPIVGGPSTVEIPLHGNPWFTKFEGVGHTHGFGFGDEDEVFSDLDMSTPYYNYLCTPNGALYRYDARNGSTSVITRDLPNMNNYLLYQWNESDYGILTTFWRLLQWKFQQQ
jgi:RHS repeat-associated protein